MFRGQHRYQDAADAFRHVLALNPDFTAAQKQLEQVEPKLALASSLEPVEDVDQWSRPPAAGKKPVARHADRTGTTRQVPTETIIVTDPKPVAGAGNTASAVPVNEVDVASPDSNEDVIPIEEVEVTFVDPTDDDVVQVDAERQVPSETIVASDPKPVPGASNAVTDEPVGETDEASPDSDEVVIPIEEVEVTFVEPAEDPVAQVDMGEQVTSETVGADDPQPVASLTSAVSVVPIDEAGAVVETTEDELRQEDEEVLEEIPVDEEPIEDVARDGNEAEDDSLDSDADVEWIEAEDVEEIGEAAE
jgi:hypothetical protein